MSSEPETLPGSAVDVVVGLLFELGDQSADSDPLDDRICEAICRLTSLERAVLLLYDPGRRLVVPAGSHGVAPEILAHVYGSLEETPIAQRAFGEDAVIVVDELAGNVPDRYTEIPTLNGISCTPVAAAGRWLGVIFADRNGGPLDLGDEEIRTMRALGRTAALATTVRQAVAEHERDSLLRERIELAREVHESVMQRLFGVSMVLGSGRELSAADAQRSAAEIEAALGELRDALERSLEPTSEPARTTLRAELERLGRQYKAVPLSVRWEPGAEVPEGLEPLAVSVLARGASQRREARGPERGADRDQPRRRRLRARGPQRRDPRAARGRLGARAAARRLRVDAARRDARVRDRGRRLAGPAGAADQRRRGLHRGGVGRWLSVRCGF